MLNRGKSCEKTPLAGQGERGLRWDRLPRGVTRFDRLAALGFRLGLSNPVQRVG
jgi:hypothetical protein